MNRLACTIALLAAAPAGALVTNPNGATPSFASDRRNFFGVLGGAAAVAVIAGAPAPASAAGAIKTGPSNPFTGDYDDPNHPGCLRQVKVVGVPIRADGSRPTYARVEVVGYDGKGGAGAACADRPTRDELWKVAGKTRGKDEAFLDFSSKGGPADLVGRWDGSGIVFPDGNKWTKLSYAPRDRRPEDMSTLSEGPL